MEAKNRMDFLNNMRAGGSDSEGTVICAACGAPVKGKFCGKCGTPRGWKPEEAPAARAHAESEDTYKELPKADPAAPTREGGTPYMESGIKEGSTPYTDNRIKEGSTPYTDNGKRGGGTPYTDSGIKEGSTPYTESGIKEGGTPYDGAGTGESRYAARESALPIRRKVKPYVPPKRRPAPSGERETGILSSVQAVENEEAQSVFAQGLPDWSIEPPQAPVRRKGMKV